MVLQVSFDGFVGVGCEKSRAGSNGKLDIVRNKLFYVIAGNRHIRRTFAHDHSLATREKIQILVGALNWS